MYLLLQLYTAYYLIAIGALLTMLWDILISA